MMVVLLVVVVVCVRWGCVGGVGGANQSISHAWCFAPLAARLQLVPVVELFEKGLAATLPKPPGTPVTVLTNWCSLFPHPSPAFFVHPCLTVACTSCTSLSHAQAAVPSRRQPPCHSLIPLLT